VIGSRVSRIAASSRGQGTAREIAAFNATARNRHAAAPLVIQAHGEGKDDGASATGVAAERKPSLTYPARLNAEVSARFPAGWSQSLWPTTKRTIVTLRFRPQPAALPLQQSALPANALSREQCSRWCHQANFQVVLTAVSSRYPTPRSVLIRRGMLGSASSLRRSRKT